MKRGTRISSNQSKKGQIKRSGQSGVKKQDEGAKQINADEEDIEERSENGKIKNFPFHVLGFAFNLVLCISLALAFIYLYLEKLKIENELINLSANQKKISQSLEQGVLSDTITKQFDKLYLTMVTPDLERKTKILDDKIKEFQGVLGSVPTSQQLVSSIDPLMEEAISELEKRLNLDFSKRIKNLSNLMENVSDDLSSGEQIEMGSVFEEVEKMKNDIADIRLDFNVFTEVIKSEHSNFRDTILKINAEANSYEAESGSVGIYSDVQKLLRIIPDLTTRAIRQEYISNTLKESGNNYWGRIKAFFGSRIVSRALEPKEGDTVNSIMSRVEDSLKELDIEGALTELSGLPEGSKPIFVGIIENLENLIDIRQGILKQEN